MNKTYKTKKWAASKAFSILPQHNVSPLILSKPILTKIKIKSKIM